MDYFSGTFDYLKANIYFSILLTVLAGYSMHYFTFIAQKPRLCANSKFRKFLVQHLPILEERFWPTFWCFEARAQTILRALIKSTPDANYHKEFIETPDGGHIALDWQENDASPIPSSTRPTVIILPGLTGSSQESYALHFVQQIMKLGYRATVFNYRGNGGADLKTPRSYCASNTEDLAQVIDHIKSRYPEAPLMAAGISLGGMHLMNLLSRPDHGLKAGFVCGAAYDLVAASDHIELPLNRIVFNTPLTKRMVASVTRYQKKQLRENVNVLREKTLSCLFFWIYLLLSGQRKFNLYLKIQFQCLEVFLGSMKKYPF